MGMVFQVRLCDGHFMFTNCRGTGRFRCFSFWIVSCRSSIFFAGYPDLVVHDRRLHFRIKIAFDEIPGQHLPDGFELNALGSKQVDAVCFLLKLHFGVQSAEIVARADLLEGVVDGIIYFMGIDLIYNIKTRHGKGVIVSGEFLRIIW